MDNLTGNPPILYGEKEIVASGGRQASQTIINLTPSKRSQSLPYPHENHSKMEVERNEVKSN